MRSVELTISEIVTRTGVIHPNIPPLQDVTYIAPAWNEGRRIRRLLGLMQVWFSQTAVAVQESTDRTLEIARAMARPDDQVLEHPHYGYGDASFPAILKAVRTPWVFEVSLDEWPTLRLLESIGSAVALAEIEGIDAYWIRFVSTIEGVRAKDTQAGHLRLFRTELGWPDQMHSRPEGTNERRWPWGHITHRRSLDEMMRDYIRYHSSDDDPRRRAHDRLMMHDACTVVAQHIGWDKVTAYDWWPEVLALAFTEERGDSMADPQPSIKLTPGRPLTHNELIVDFVDFPPNQEISVKITGPISQPYWTTLRADGVGQAQLIWRSQSAGDYTLSTKSPDAKSLSEDFTVSYQEGEEDLIARGILAPDRGVKSVEDPEAPAEPEDKNEKQAAKRKPRSKR